jgi:carbamoyl-phosphate synthase large subunit
MTNTGSDVSMKSNDKKKILITGVGGGVGQAIIKSLQNTPYGIISTDGEILGTGLYASPKAYTVPYANSPMYIHRLLQICEAENCSLIFPGLDAELPVLARERQRFIDIGTTPVVSSSDIIEIADDKLATHNFLIRNNQPTPSTYLLSEDVTEHLPFPFILKPRKGGFRSRDVFLIRDKREFSFRLSVINTDNYIAQEYIEGDEYTCGSVNFDGKCYGIIVMKRILRDGDTYKAFVVSDPAIEDYVRRAAEALKPFGACNFQLRVCDGVPYIFEINARCSGTTYCRTLAGFNEPLMVADFLIHGKLPDYKIQEITIMRYWNELLVSNDRIEKLSKEGSLKGSDLRL